MHGALERWNGAGGVDCRGGTGVARRTLRLGAMILALSAALPCGATPGATASTVVVTADEIRAAFLFQLAQYADWPAESFASASSPLRFCVVGDDVLAATLEKILRGKQIEGRPVAAATVRAMHEISGCHVAFIAVTKEKKLVETFAKWTYPPVLLVGQANRFAELGGMVNLVVESGRISFEINVVLAESAHLRLRSQLLRLAKIVEVKKELGK